jgi:hypothetical protein
VHDGRVCNGASSRPKASQGALQKFGEMMSKTTVQFAALFFGFAFKRAGTRGFRNVAHWAEDDFFEIS